MKKHWISMLMLVILLVGICVPASADSDYATAYVYTANGKSLNLRSTPTSSDNKIGNIPFGAEVTVYTYLDSDTWAHVSYNAQTGYVMTRYLVSYYPGTAPSTSSSSTTSTTTTSTLSFTGLATTSYYATVCPSTPGGFVHMRWAPSKNESIYADYYAGTTLEVIAQNTTWAQVRDPDTGKVGFMMRAFLQ